MAPLLLSASAAFAEEQIKVGAIESRPANTGEYIILALPIIVYSLFSVYRAKVNPRVKVSDFLFILAAAVIVGNILSIAIFDQFENLPGVTLEPNRQNSVSTQDLNEKRSSSKRRAEAEAAAALGEVEPGPSSEPLQKKPRGG